MKASSGGGVAHSIGGLERAMGVAGLLVPPVAALWLWQAAHLLPVSFQDLGAVVVMLWIVLAGNRIYRSTRAKREAAAAFKRAEQEAAAERRWQAELQRDAERRREQVEQEREAGNRKWHREEAVRRASGTNAGWWNVLELSPNAS
jgi:hypothetical protein